MQDVLAKLKEIQENYDNEDIQRAINAAKKTAVAEEQVNEFYVKSAKDVLNTLPAFAYRASDPVDNQPEDKMYTAAVGDRAEMLYNKLRKWLAAGNDFSPEEIEALDQAASAPEFIGLRGGAEDDQDVIDMLNSGLDTLEDIIGNKTESVEESLDNSDLERMIKLAGRSGVLGMNTNVIIAESVEEDDMSTGTAGGVAGQGKKRRATGINDNPYDHNEGQDTAALVNAALWNMKDVYQTVLAGEELSERDIFSYGDLVQYLEMEELPDTYSEFYDLVSDAIDSASGGGEFNPGDAIAVDKNIAPKIKTLYQQFKAATAKIEGIKEDSVEEVHEEEAVEETVEVPVSALQELMKLAGYEQYKIDEYANEPEENYSSAEDQMDLGGGLNGPKKAYAAAAGGDNPMDQEPTEIEEDNKLTFEGMYKRYMTQVVEETLEEKE